jgi:hypothetical protein
MFLYRKLKFNQGEEYALGIFFLLSVAAVGADNC